MDSLSAFFRTKLRAQRTTGATSRVRSYNPLLKKDTSKYVSVTRSASSDVVSKVAEMQRTLNMIEEYLGPLSVIEEDIQQEDEDGRETN